MPSKESHSSCYSSSGSSTSSLSSPRLPSLTDPLQQQQQTAYPPMRIPSTPTAKTSITPSHGCVTRYKTELCRPFTETGKCKYGDKCQFSHGLKELRVLMRHPKYKTEYCRTFHTTGYCPYGPRCHFIHDIHEARTAIDPNEPGTVRRHSDGRTPHSAQKATARNRMNSDYPTYSEQSHPSSSRFPFSFDELNQALLSYETGDVFQGHEQAQIYPSIFSAIPDNTLTRRTCSSSSSSNSSLIPQYV